MTGVIEQARSLGSGPYDRQVLTGHLVEQLRGWRFAKRYDDNRMLRAVHATFDVLDGLEGASLAARWVIFEQQVWPRWQAGQDRPDRGTRWGFGVWALVISRLVRPQWATIATVRVGDWTKILPPEDSIAVARQRLLEAAQTCAIGSPKSYEIAVNMATRLMLIRGAERLDDLAEDDLLIPALGTKGGDVLDVLLCQLGVLDRTARSGTARRRTAPRRSERELAVVAGVPEPFVAVVGLYLETYARRLSDSYTTLRAKAVSLGHFFRYLRDVHPEVTSCSQVLPAHARGFVPHAIELARASQRSHPRKGNEDRTTAHSWLIEIRVFFADISTWATETDSPFAGHAPSNVVLTRHDLRDTGFAKARRRQQARLTSTVLDLQREIPNIRAFALRRWHDAEQALREHTEDKGLSKELVDAERVAFWDWGLLELLLTSGLRIEEACELTTFDVLRRSLPDGRLYYLLHIKPSKFGRARVIPIGDQLGRAIAEIIRHVRGYYGTDHVPLVDRRDEHEKRPLPRAPYLLQGIRHPSAVNTNTIRGRLRWLSEQAGAKHADGAPLILTPHDCRRVFASE